MDGPACPEGRTLSDLNRMVIYSVIQMKWSTVLFLILCSDLKEDSQYFQFVSSFTLPLHTSPVEARKCPLSVGVALPYSLPGGVLP